MLLSRSALLARPCPTCGLGLKPRRARLPAGAMPCRAQHEKRSIEDITASQPSAAEPGGEVGRQDPGPKAAAGQARELDIDAELRAAVEPLLRRTRASLAERHAHSLSPCAVAEAAVAAAEASGALPPLAGAQRAALEAFFARLAEGLGPAQPSDGEGFEKFGSSGGEALYGEEDAVLRVRPMQTEILEAAINAHLASRGSPRRSRSPADSVQDGGEVGNIALQSDTHGSEEPRGVPAESRTDRAERQANEAFMELELGDLPAESQPDAARQAQWEDHRRQVAAAANAAVEGDAPSAGGGMQVVESPAEQHQIGGAGLPFSKDQCTAGPQASASGGAQGGAGGAGQ